MKRIEVNIPESLNDITVRQYQLYTEIAKINEGNDEFIGMKMIEIFCGVKLIDVYKLPVNAVEEILQKIGAIFQAKRKFVNRFTLKGVEYGFIPDLEEISMGEYIDISNYMKDPENMNLLMGVLYRPITKKVKDLYDIESYEGSEKYGMILSEMPLGIALEAQFFFLNLANELVNYMSHYSQLSPRMKELVDSQELTYFKGSGAGTIPSMPLLKVTS